MINKLKYHLPDQTFNVFYMIKMSTWVLVIYHVQQSYKVLRYN